MNINFFNREGFVERLELIRAKSGLSKGDFADKIQVKNAIGRYKSGYIKVPSVDTLLRIHQIFDVDVTWLLTGKGPAPEKSASNLEDLDRLFKAAREKAEADPDFAGWLKVELKKVID